MGHYSNACQGRILLILNEIHVRVCGAHKVDSKLVDLIKGLGIIDQFMVEDATKFAEICQVSQIHGGFIYYPPQLLHPNILSWPLHT